LDGYVPWPDIQTLQISSQANAEDIRFKRDLMSDLEDWIIAEIKVVADKLEEREQETELERLDAISSS